MLDTRPFSETMTAERRSGQGATLRWEIQILLRRQASPYWLLGALSLAGTFINAPLVLSAGVGLAVHQQLTQLSPQQWQLLATQLQRRWTVPSPKAKVWLLSAAAVMTTYGVTALWSDTHALWLSVVLAGQSLLSVALVGLLLRPATPSSAPPSVAEMVSTPLEAALLKLVHEDPLKRLIGVRQVVRQALQQANQEYLPGQTVRSHLIDCLHLMLSQEDEPLVRTAIREGLDLLREKPQLASGAPAVNPPLRQAQAQKDSPQPAARARRAVVEYVEP